MKMQNLKKALLAMVEEANLKESILDIYDAYLEKVAEERGLEPGSDEYVALFAKDEEECIPWFVDGYCTDQVLAYVNKNFKMVPIYEYPADKAYANIVKGMKSEVQYMKEVNSYLSEDSRSSIMGSIFDKKACLVGFTDYIGGDCNPYGFWTMRDLFETYLFSDGSFAVVQANSYSFDGFDDDKNVCTLRRLVPDAYPIFDHLEEQVSEDYQGICLE